MRRSPPSITTWEAQATRKWRHPRPPLPDCHDSNIRCNSSLAQTIAYRSSSKSLFSPGFVLWLLKCCQHLSIQSFLILKQNKFPWIFSSKFWIDLFYLFQVMLIFRNIDNLKTSLLLALLINCSCLLIMLIVRR